MTNKVKIRSWYVDDNNGRVTIASKIENDYLLVGVSFCSPKDINKYSKTKGQEIAIGRLHKTKIWLEKNLNSENFIASNIFGKAIITLNKGESVSRRLYRGLEALAECKDFAPNWFPKFIKKYNMKNKK